jgi:hypothetical protein
MFRLLRYPRCPTSAIGNALIRVSAWGHFQGKFFNNFSRGCGGAYALQSVNPDSAVSLATLKAIKQFALLEPTVILPTHDPSSESRLASGEIYT